MGKIVEFLGNSGSGKTTLVGELAKTGQFDTGIELHPIRPFHNLSVEKDPAYALANQVDFLLYRAEQEKVLRSGERIGLLDGGLEQDFFIFSALFHEKGFLDTPSFEICQRLYHFFRESLGDPDLIIVIEVPVEEVVKRFARRGRQFEITQTDDLEKLERLIRQSIQYLNPETIVRLDGLLPITELVERTLDTIQTRLEIGK